MKIKTLKIVGVEELINAICGENGDSFSTHLEDAKHDLTAPFQFVAGEKDLAELKRRITEEHEPIRNAIRVYFEMSEVPVDIQRVFRNNCALRFGNLGVASYADLIEIRYMRVDQTCLDTLNDWLQFIEWIKSLPYQELLTA